MAKEKDKDNKIPNFAEYERKRLLELLQLPFAPDLVDQQCGPRQNQQGRQNQAVPGAGGHRVTLSRRRPDRRRR